MKILLIHNHYQYPGGEDIVVAQETTLLRSFGHEVHLYQRTNRELADLSAFEWASIPFDIIWSRSSARELRELLAKVKPDIVHVHNTFFRISPSLFYVCAEFNIPVVQTLHNYRLLCPRADFFRKSAVCELCIHKSIPWLGILHACYRGSRIQSAGVASITAIHRLLRTWDSRIEIFIALTEFSHQKFIAGGIPAELIRVKPNFVFPDPGQKSAEGDYALFVGRLSPQEKVETLLKAWRTIGHIPLKIVGTGPEILTLSSIAKHYGLGIGIFKGGIARDQVFAYMRGARFLIFPSEWYESFPMVIVEAFACGVPVIASRLGAMGEIVDDGRTGLLFNPGDSEDLARKVEWAWTHEKEIAEMGKEARREYELKYTAERNYQMLMAIYQLAIDRARKRYGTHIERH